MNDIITQKLTISGFRGIIGSELTDETVLLLTDAFLRMLQEETGKETLHILIGRDGRESGVHIEQTIAGSVVETGNTVTVGGMLTTPSVCYLTKTLPFDGAIIITASHNPIEYNGLKFVTKDGFFIAQEQVQKIKELLSLKETLPRKEGGEAVQDTTLANMYTDYIASCFAKLKTKIRVIVDPVNSSGTLMALEFLRTLGCDVIVINDDPIGIFARPPEPNPSALLELGRATLGYAMDIGFGLDPDADRLVLVDENGIPVFEEYTLALCAKALYTKLEKEGALDSVGPYVINLSSSRVGEDVARSFGIETKRSPVGEASVVKKMIQEKSMFGGEGNGGVIFRPINFCRDSFVGMALILSLMEETGKKLSELVAELPKYVMIKEKVTGITDFPSYIPKLIESFQDGAIDQSDGVRFDFPDSSWVHIRSSNTEPIVRIIGEAKEESRIQELIEKAKDCLQ